MIKDTLNPLNFVILLQKSLEAEVKKVVVDLIVEEETKKFEDQLRDKIKDLVEKVSFKHFESIKDLYTLRDEVRLVIEWKEKYVV